MSITPERQDILDLMQPGHLYTVSAIATALGKSRINIQQMMTKMLNAGVIKRVRYGQYALADDPIATDAPPVLASAPGVYILRCNDMYKIGMSDNVPSRVAYLIAALPNPSQHVHTIACDDPSGLEALLHARFADKRVRGEWFALDMFDVDELLSM